jgi:hypothetical protein
MYHAQSGLLAQYEAPISRLELPTDADIEAALDRFIAIRGLEADRYGCAGCGTVFCSSELTKLRLGHTILNHLCHEPEYSFESMGSPMGYW